MILGVLFAVIGAGVVSNPDYLVDSSVSPAAIEADPEAAAAQARRSIQLRGGTVAIVGVFLFIGGFAWMF